MFLPSATSSRADTMRCAIPPRPMRPDGLALPDLNIGCLRWDCSTGRRTFVRGAYVNPQLCPVGTADPGRPEPGRTYYDARRAGRIHCLFGRGDVAPSFRSGTSCPSTAGVNSTLDNA